MNYLERLLRRALLEAPANAGGVLHDPFAEEAPWPLTEPAAAAPRVTAADPIAAALAVPAPEWPANHALPDVPPLAPSEAQYWPGAELHETFVQVRQQAQPVAALLQPPAAAAAPAALAPDPVAPLPPLAAADELSPLAQADAFMRALAGPLAALPLPAAPAPASAVRPQATAPVRAQADLAAPQTGIPPARLQPPASPAPLAATATPAVAAPASAAVTTSQAETPAASRAQPAVQLPAAPSQLITVLAASATSASSVAATAHRFGIGQL